jgi:hypothetical protein
MAVIISPNICDLINTSVKLDRLEFNPNLKIDKSKLTLLNSNYYNLLFNYPEQVTDSSYVYGQFDISKNRKGLVCYNTTIISSSLIDWFSLHIIDDCKVNRTIYISGREPFYDYSSSFSKTMDTLTIITNRISKYAFAKDSRKDTIIASTYKINLKSPLLDTVFRQSTFKLFKHEKTK